MKTVLVIEDELQTRNVFLKCLEFEGFRACGAGNGSEGIELAKWCHPDLVICDIMMPDMDGYSVLSTLRQSPDTAAIPLIFLTAKVTMADLRRGMELGADDYLTKPCTVEQFLSAIATRLTRHNEIVRAAIRSSIEPDQPSAGTSDAILDPFDGEPFFPDCPRLTKVFQFIEHHYRESIQLDDVAQEVGIPPPISRVWCRRKRAIPSNVGSLNGAWLKPVSYLKQRQTLCGMWPSCQGMPMPDISLASFVRFMAFHLRFGGKSLYLNQDLETRHKFNMVICFLYQR